MTSSDFEPSLHSSPVQFHRRVWGLFPLSLLSYVPILLDLILIRLFALWFADMPWLYFFSLFVVYIY